MIQLYSLSISTADTNKNTLNLNTDIVDAFEIYSQRLLTRPKMTALYPFQKHEKPR